jgi:hypothetical protein
VTYRPNKTPKFVSGVIPAEFVDWLNESSDEAPGAIREAWGRLFIDVTERLPRAALFPDGLLATHGGVPLEDRWHTLMSMEAFHSKRTLEDFTWTRIASGVAVRKGWKYDPNRRANSSAFDLGYRDVEGFARAVADVLPVRRIVRGHDHVEGGAEHAEGYDAVPVLTLNGFGFDHLTNSTRKYTSHLALGVYIANELPRVDRVEVPDRSRAVIYPPSHPGEQIDEAPIG